MKQSANIFIRDLIVNGHHGMSELEKSQLQKFKINLEITYDMRQAQLSDNVKDAVNWSELKDKAINVIETTSFNLMEALIDKLASTLMEDQRITSLHARIDKIDAFESGYPGLEIRVSR